MDTATLEGIRFRHDHVEAGADSMERLRRSSDMAYLSHLDRKDLLDEVDRLRAECFKRSAGVCEHRGGNEHGNPLCLKTNLPI